MEMLRKIVDKTGICQKALGNTVIKGFSEVLFCAILLSGNKMEKSNYKEWLVDFNGKIIKVSNWWNWEGKSSKIYI